MIERREQQTLLALLGAKEQPSDIIDENLNVSAWPTGGGRPRHASTKTAADHEDVPGLTPPAWWQDDQDASQTFLGAMGVGLE